jgi:hypothetical protein
MGKFAALSERGRLPQTIEITVKLNAIIANNTELRPQRPFYHSKGRYPGLSQ